MGRLPRLHALMEESSRLLSNKRLLGYWYHSSLILSAAFDIVLSSFCVDCILCFLCCVGGRVVMCLETETLSKF
jgi:hypothetical protein